MLDKIQMEMLLSQAREVRKKSYSPYSHFSVGAALMTADGRIYLGCNVENGAFTPTCCAERVAFFSAISDGARDFFAIAVVGNTSPCMPCGVCRQVMSEFCRKDFEIVFEGDGGKAESLTLGELLPYSFKLEEKK